MSGRWLPIETKEGDDGEIVRILIHENLYDHLSPLYKRLRWISGAITEVPGDINNAAELFSYLRMEFEAFGWGVSIAILRLLSYAVNQAIPIGKFVYRRFSTGFTYGGEHGTTYDGSGSTLAGSDSGKIIVEEIGN